jgi:hypothetical protein
MNTSHDLAELRQSIAAGSYHVDSHAVATSIVRRLVEISRMRRAVEDPDSPFAQMLEPGGGSYAAVWRT